MAKNRKDNVYWKDRFQALEDERYRRGKAYYKDLQKQFRMAANDIQMDIEHWYRRLAENNEISYAAAKRLLNEKELEEFKWSVEEYIEKGKANAVNQKWIKQLENASARRHISYLEAMKLQIQQHAELLYTEYEGGMTTFLNKAYEDRYYHTAYEIAKGTGFGTSFSRLDTRKIDYIIRKPWAQDGANFSERIWSDKEKLVNTLHTELAQTIIRGAPPRAAIDAIAKTMNVSKSQASRLVLTELAAISAAANRDCFEKLGVEKYQILVSLDETTCPICQDLDGKFSDMKEFEVGLTASPFHPNCRCTEIPYFEDEFTEDEERAARTEDGKTFYVPGNMKYEEWKEKFVHPVSDDKRDTKSPDYLIRNHKGATNTLKERLAVNEAIAAVPPKVLECINAGTIIDVGKIGASQYDYSHDIMYIAKGAEKEDVIHEIGHLVENKMLDPNKVEELKSKLFENVPVNDIITETYYDTNGEPREIFVLLSDQLVSDYQGRLYVEDWSEIYDENWNVRTELLQEFISEIFRVFMENPEKLKKKYPEYYELIREVVE